MPTDELVHDAPSNVVDAPTACSFPNARVKHGLKDEIAKLLAECLHVSCVDRVDRLVSLLDEVLSERLVGLLLIPGASSGPEQATHHVGQFAQRSGIGTRQEKRRAVRNPFGRHRLHARPKRRMRGIRMVGAVERFLFHEPSGGERNDPNHA